LLVSRCHCPRTRSGRKPKRSPTILRSTGSARPPRRLGWLGTRRPFSGGVCQCLVIHLPWLVPRRSGGICRSSRADCRLNRNRRVCVSSSPRSLRSTGSAGPPRRLGWLGTRRPFSGGVCQCLVIHLPWLVPRRSRACAEFRAHIADKSLRRTGPAEPPQRFDRLDSRRPFIGGACPCLAFEFPWLVHGEAAAHAWVCGQAAAWLYPASLSGAARLLVCDAQGLPNRPNGSAGSTLAVHLSAACVRVSNSFHCEAREGAAANRPVYQQTILEPFVMQNSARD